MERDVDQTGQVGHVAIEWQPEHDRRHIQVRRVRNLLAEELGVPVPGDGVHRIQVKVRR